MALHETDYEIKNTQHVEATALEDKGKKQIDVCINFSQQNKNKTSSKKSL